MKLTELAIHRFGLLRDRTVGVFGDGLNVVHGPNGAGKSTLFQFVRGLLHGFGDATRTGLLGRVPADGSPGTITFSHDDRTGECNRVVDGNAGRFHSSLNSFVVEKSSRSIGFQDPYEPNGTETLLRAAESRGIDLHESSQPQDELDALRELLEADRRRGTESLRTTLNVIRRVSAQVRTAESVRRNQLAEFEGRRSKRTEQRETLERRIAEANDDRDRLLAELDDLQRRDTLEEQERHRRTAERAARIEERLRSLAELDARIERLRAVLEDLDTRAVELQRDVERSAAVPFDETFDAAAAVRDIEAEVGNLARSESIRRQGGSGDASCCRAVTATAEVLRERVYRLCETLGQREVAWRAVLARRELDELDAGRRGLRHRLDALAKRRLDEASRLDSAGVFESLGRTPAVEDFCHCEGHASHLETLRRHLDGLREAATPPASGFEARSRLEGELERLRVRIAEVDARIADDERQLATLAEDVPAPRVGSDEGIRLRAELADHRREFVRLAGRDRELGRQLAIVASLREKPRRGGVPAIVAEASACLKRITRESYARLRVVDDRVELLADKRGWIDHRRTSAGTQHVVGLVLRLAINAELHRRGEGVPLLLDDVLVHNDVDRQRIAFEVLAEYAADGQQIVMFTCHEHIRDDGGDRGGRVLEFSKQGTVAVTPAAERPRPVRPEPRVVPTPTVAKVEEPLPAETDDEPAYANTLTFDVVPTFALNADDEVRRVPQTKKRDARILALAGVHTVGDLLGFDVDGRLPLLEHHRLERATIVRWQSLARLLVTIPSLKAVDASALAEMGIHDAETLTALDEREFESRLARLQRTAVGRGLLQSGRRFDLDWFRDVQGYTRFARTIEESRRENSGRGRSQRGRSRPRQHVSEPRSRENRQAREELATRDEGGLRFFLSRTSPLEDAPSIGPKTAGRFIRIGVRTVDEFLVVDADEAASRIDKRHITADTIRAWKLQAELVCRVPELRGHDAQILVACGIETPEALAAAEPRKLLAIVTPFCKSSAGQRVIRSGKAPDLAEVTAWIAWANRSRTLRAA